MNIDDIEIGYQIKQTQQITEQAIQDFALVSGDNNKVHLDDNYAKTTVFKKRIAHGFLYGSFISKILGSDYPGQGTVYLEQSMKFIYPVYIGDNLEIVVTVLEKIPKNKVKLSTKIFNQDNKIVLDGTALVSVPSS